MGQPLPTAWLNDHFLPLAEARISPLDRGFLFGDGVYEVIPVYDGRPFRLEAHLDRLDYSLDEIRIRNPLSRPDWRRVLGELVERNGGGDQSLYLQVTRGADEGRDHGFPDPSVPATRFAMTSPLKPMPNRIREQGASVLLLPDERWARCDIKAITLLANVLARQTAREMGADEAVLERDGQLMEGSSTTLYALFGETVVTAPRDHRILPGITREVVLDLVRAVGLDIREAHLPCGELAAADECWLSSSSRELIPVTRVHLADGASHAVGPVDDSGRSRPGPVWARLAGELHELARNAQA